MIRVLYDELRQKEIEEMDRIFITDHKILLAIVLAHLQSRTLARDLKLVEWCLLPFY